MTNKQLRRRLREAVERSAPADFGAVLSRLPERKGTVTPMTTTTAKKKRPALRALMAACLALVAAAGVKMLLPAASDERPESEAAGFNVTGAQYEAPGSNALEDRDIENYDLAPGGETEAPASGDDCVAEIRSVTVTCGNVTAYFDDAAEIDELAAIFAYGGEASGLPGEQADYILTIEGESRSVQLRAWESDGALLCELDGGRTWKAAGTAAELEKLAG